MKLSDRILAENGGDIDRAYADACARLNRAMMFIPLGYLRANAYLRGVKAKPALPDPVLINGES